MKKEKFRTDNPSEGGGGACVSHPAAAEVPDAVQSQCGAGNRKRKIKRVRERVREGRCCILASVNNTSPLSADLVVDGMAPTAIAFLYVICWLLAAA
jgi:hypothetical protein